jgi:Rrf2 family protein
MLRLTRRAEYGLMAMAFLARGEAHVSVREIGDRLGIPRRLLAEVLKDLARGGLVEGARGPNGGYRLVAGAGALPLGRVVEVLEGPIQVADCADGGACEHVAGCSIQHGMRFVAGRIKQVLDQSTLADLVAAAESAAGRPAAAARLPV